MIRGTIEAVAVINVSDEFKISTHSMEYLSGSEPSLPV